jgi:hypothetical protein
LISINIPIKCRQYNPYDIEPSLEIFLNEDILKNEFLEKFCSIIINTIIIAINERSKAAEEL